MTQLFCFIWALFPVTIIDSVGYFHSIPAGTSHNEFVAKKEIDPTLHIYEKVDNKFYIVQVFLRIIL